MQAQTHAASFRAAGSSETGRDGTLVPISIHLKGAASFCLTDLPDRLRKPKYASSECHQENPNREQNFSPRPGKGEQELNRAQTCRRGLVYWVIPLFSARNAVSGMTAAAFNIAQAL